ncbi:MAG: hypothetical protein M1509_07030, partial [Nitrospirae bacterium]|nr:hypothetical protein [Nitrospirota bacterium]
APAHPGLVDFEVQQGYSGPVLWSTRSGEGAPLAPPDNGRTLQPLPFNPSLRVGRPFFSPSIGTNLLPLGALVPGSSLYVRTHVRMDALLPPPPPGLASGYRVDFSYAGPRRPSPDLLRTASPSRRSLRIPVDSYPFRVTVSWPPGTALLLYERLGRLRWSLEIGGVLFLSGLGSSFSRGSGWGSSFFPAGRNGSCERSGIFRPSMRPSSRRPGRWDS